MNGVPDDLAPFFGRDVEDFGVDANDVGSLWSRAALLQVELDGREHLGRREGTQVEQGMWDAHVAAAAH